MARLVTSAYLFATHPLVWKSHLHRYFPKICRRCKQDLFRTLSGGRGTTWQCILLGLAKWRGSLPPCIYL